jgi:hypothetical protein
LGWGHPAVVLQHGKNPDGSIWIIVANVSEEMARY